MLQFYKSLSHLGWTEDLPPSPEGFRAAASISICPVPSALLLAHNQMGRTQSSLISDKFPLHCPGNV